MEGKRANILKGIPNLPTGPPQQKTLSPWERRVIRELLAGKADKEISASLKVSAHEVSNAFKSVRRKLNLKSRVQIVIWAYARPEDLELWRPTRESPREPWIA